MSGDIAFERSSDGLIVRVGRDHTLPIHEWTSRGSPGAGALIRLRDDGGAVERENGSALWVSWKSVAELTSDELRYTGLPDAAPFALEVVANGAIHDSDFEIRCGYIRDGRRVLGVQREGAWLHAGGEDFVLLDPLYSVAEAIDQFNQPEKKDLESKMLRWGPDCGDAACRRRCRRRQLAFTKNLRGFQLRARTVRQRGRRAGFRSGRRQARDPRQRGRRRGPRVRPRLAACPAEGSSQGVSVACPACSIGTWPGAAATSC